MNETITVIDGILVGHATDSVAKTGCTAVLCESGAVAGVDVRGSAPGTRETYAIRPGRVVQKAHAVLLTGGSAFGLDAAGGVMQFLEERGVGYATRVGPVPIVPAAVIFDLGVGDAHVRPDKAMGYRAAQAASGEPVAMGLIGAGTGATIGKTPVSIPSPGGLGSALHRGPSGLLVGAVAMVNAIGNVINPATGRTVSGAMDPATREFVDVSAVLGRGLLPEAGTNTTIGVVATNARLTPAEATKVAEMAHDGLARAIRPSHTMRDGDTIFALATGELDADVTRAGILASDVFAEAILWAVRPH